MWKDTARVNLVHTDAYSHLSPADVRPKSTGMSQLQSFQNNSADRSTLQQVQAFITQSLQEDQDLDTSQKNAKDVIKIDMEIKLPPKEKKKKKVVEKQMSSSLLSDIFANQKFPEPRYFQNVDCVGLPMLFTPRECKLIIDFSEAQGFSMQQRHRVLNLMWCDIVDPFFAESIWQVCGLGWFLRTIKIDGMIPCGINDVIRIQKYVQGSLFGRHVDQPVRREDGKVSKYSLRVFLNDVVDDFEGGLSVFHMPFRQEQPVIFEPQAGLGLLYPQGELCTVQEETEVLFGCKYVLRADVLFCKPEDFEGRRGEFR